MTVKEIELKYWLNRAFYADKKVMALKQCVEQAKSRIEGTSKGYEGNYASNACNAENGTENAMFRLLDFQNKLDRQIAELVDVTNEIYDAINSLDDVDLQTVLIHRYILFHTIEQTAEFMNYSERTIRHKQKVAIEKLCLLLPCFAY